MLFWKFLIKYIIKYGILGKVSFWRRIPRAFWTRTCHGLVTKGRVSIKNSPPLPLSVVEVFSWTSNFKWKDGANYWNKNFSDRWYWIWNQIFDLVIPVSTRKSNWNEKFESTVGIRYFGTCRFQILYWSRNLASIWTL